MHPVKVLFPFAGDTVLGGSHISALNLAAALDPARFAPLVLMHNRAGVVGDYARARGLDCEVLEDVPLLGARAGQGADRTGAFGFVARTLPALVRKIRETDAAIVHTQDGRMHVNWSLATKLSGRRHVWHHRQDPGAFGVNRIAPLLADRIISVSHFSRPSRPLRPIDARFDVVRSPFETGGARPDRAACHAELCAEIGAPADAVLLGYFGLLNPRKRPVHFVEAVAAIRAALPGRAVHGLIFGTVESRADGLDLACAARAAELGLAGNLHLMGFRAPIDRCMAGVDATLVTALGEPFGRTLIEAMCLGTPVVATRHGGNPEAIEDGVTGFLVDPADPAAFAPPVLRLVSDPALAARVTETAQRRVIRDFGTDIHAHRIMEIYDSLIPPPAKGGRADAFA